MLLETNFLESENIKKIHFIGIDGISMSGLAEMLLNLGYTITGSDMKTSHKTQKLEKLGAKIYGYHSEDNISDQDLVVYTAAIKETNPEFIKARKLNIPLIDRATLLGQIMKRYPYSIAVSGTHGKTTTTSMIASIMLEAGVNPTVHIGAELDKIGGATKIGGSKYFIAEACEYTGSFLKFFPYLAVILNIDFDHADYFKDIEHVKDTFYQFASLVPENGYLVACADDPNTVSLLDKLSCNKITYGVKSDNAMWRARDISFDDMGCASFTVLRNNDIFAAIKLSIPGMHNVSNALAAIATCHVFECDVASIQQALYDFTGANRRFELKGIVNNIKVVDDYAHHPSEIKATLKAAKNGSSPRIWCVFQPHTYTRTKFLLDEFAGAFDDASHVILADIYAAREIDTGEIHSRTLADRINARGGKAIYISGFDTIVKHLEANVLPGDMIITMGAGDIYRVGEMYLGNKKVAAVS